MDGFTQLQVGFSPDQVVLLKALAQAHIAGDCEEEKRLEQLIGEQVLMACAIAANETK